ncbi:hypothetical protein D3C77_646430 [compost metagenome]
MPLFRIQKAEQLAARLIATLIIMADTNKMIAMPTVCRLHTMWIWDKDITMIVPPMIILPNPFIPIPVQKICSTTGIGRTK